MTSSVGIDLTQPCTPWPPGFRPLCAHEAVALLTMSMQGASDLTAERNRLTILGIEQGNLCCAFNPKGRLACMPTLRGRRRLN